MFLERDKKTGIYIHGCRIATMGLAVSGQEIWFGDVEARVELPEDWSERSKWKTSTSRFGVV